MLDPQTSLLLQNFLPSLPYQVCFHFLQDFNIQIYSFMFQGLPWLNTWCWQKFPSIHEYFLTILFAVVFYSGNRPDSHIWSTHTHTHTHRLTVALITTTILLGKEKKTNMNKHHLSICITFCESCLNWNETNCLKAESLFFSLLKMIFGSFLICRYTFYVC